MRSKRNLIQLCLLATALLPALASEATTLVVTNKADAGPGSLRQIIASATAGSSIIFTNNLSGATILLTSGQLTLSNNITIDASALTNGVQISGNGTSRVFYVTNGATVTLTALTIANGAAPSDSGGGIFNLFGTLTLNRCTLTGNQAAFLGGAICNDNGTLIVNQCTLTGNGDGEVGGGIDNFGGNLAVNQCTVSGNHSSNPGGGIYNAGTMTLTNSIVAGNGDSDSGADIATDTGTTSLGGTNIVQYYVQTDGGTFSGTTPITNAPQLAALGNYGGLTQTMPPLTGSPAIDAGSDSATNFFATDQRGYPRRAGLRVDLGAVELQTPFLVVTSNEDSGPGSLRQIISQVDVTATITFTNKLSGATILLTSGQLTLSNFPTIDASALANGIQINGGGKSRVFSVANNANVVLTALTITNGAALLNNAGGGIFINGGTLTLNQCTLTGNYSTNANAGGGGGIYDFDSTLTLNECTLTGNYSAYLGGGIYNNSSTLTLNQCTLTENYSTTTWSGGGGAICNVGTLTVNQSTITGNYMNNAGDAGGIYNYGGTTLFNSIVAGNSAVYNPAGADIVTDTLHISMGGTNIVQNYVQIYGGTFSGTTPITNTPQLGPLGNYGGLTQTMPPLSGSPAIDAGSDSATNLFATDQRAYPRRAGQHVDIGAMELQTPFLAVTTNADFGPGSLRQILSQMDASATITFTNKLSGSAILLTGGPLTLSNFPTIDASALTNGIQINGNGAARIFNVAGGAIVVLTALTLTNGNDQTHVGGGGIYNSSFLTVNQCTLAGNNANNISTPAGGGAIFNSGTLAVNQCTMTGNNSDNDVDDVGNYIGGGGGAIFSSGNLAVNQCTLARNHSDNSAGGGICNSGLLIVYNSIVAGNTANNGSGADVLNSSSNPDPNAPSNASLFGTNLIQGFSGSFSGFLPINAAPQLAALGSYGGPTQTMPPLSGSPAINACINSTNFITDQRGAPRIPGGISDIGSVELAPPMVATLPATGTVNSNATLNATINPNTFTTTAWFQWGVTNNDPNNSYGRQTTPVAVGSGSIALAFSNNLTGLLTPGVVYHCRVVATNSDGSANGNEVLFGSPPVVTLFGAASVTNECHTVFTDPGATNSLGLPVTVTGLLNTNAPNTYQLTYTVTNALGTGTAIRLVTVVDTIAPIITILGNNPMSILTNTPFVDPGATALDACGGGFIVTATNNVNPAVAGSYVVTYSSTDSYNNTATAMRTVVVRAHLVFVTTTNDNGSGSLRQAIATSYAGDTIQFATNLSSTTILLTSGQLALTNNLTIDASALPGGIQINGNTNDRIFLVVSNATVVLNALTMTNGYGLRAVMLTNFGGGGIFNEGTVTLNQCILTGNHADYITNPYLAAGGGGGICNSGTLTLNQCTLTGNHADYGNNYYFGAGGGGIYNSGTLMVNQCTLTGNHADYGESFYFYSGGGGIYNSGTLMVNQCTLTGNHADNDSYGGGGGIINFGTLTVNECTLTGNHADNDSYGGGGGIIDYGTLTVNQCTLTGNHADNGTESGGGGIIDTGDLQNIYNSIVTGNASTNYPESQDIGCFSVNFSGANIIEIIYVVSAPSGPPPINADPQLAALGNYGGPTQTMPPLPGSPAIDACFASTFTTDQRGAGFPRLLGAFPDIGAVEGIYNPNGPGKLAGMKRLGNGSTQFTFTNYTDGSSTVLASTNLTMPLSLWLNLGPAAESPIGSGQFQFTDLQATNNPQRFYRVRIP